MMNNSDPIMVSIKNLERNTSFRGDALKSPFGRIYQGFTLIEFLLALLIMAIIMPIISNQFIYYYKRSHANELTMQTLAYAHAYNHLLIDKYQDYLINLTESNNLEQVKALDFSDQDAKNYLPIGMKATNALGQTPCLAMKYNSQLKNIQAVMYYVGKNPNRFDEQVVKMSMHNLGSMAGIVDGKGSRNIYGSGNAWQLNIDNEDIFDGSASFANCVGTNILNNTLVINLGFMDDFLQDLESNSALARGHLAGEKQGLGDPTNHNTIHTDIILTHHNADGTTSPHGIYFGSGSNPKTDPYLTLRSNPAIVEPSQNNKEVVMANANFIAKTLQPSKEGVVNQQDACLANEIGKMARQKDNSGDENQVVRGQLQCTYNPALCGNQHDYCYTPIMETTKIMHLNAPSASCPDSNSWIKDYTLANTDPPIQTCRWDSEDNVDFDESDVVYTYKGASVYRTIIDAKRTWRQATCGLEAHDVTLPVNVTSITCSSETPTFEIKGDQ